MEYRNLNPQEISSLERQGCRCADWGAIQVAEPFAPENYRNVWLAGTVFLGSAKGECVRTNGLHMPYGVYDATIQNCTIGPRVLINKVGNYISDYDIEEDTIIENVGRIAMTGPSTFGNGVEVSVLNETGGREVPIYDHLSAHIAYMLAMYRHDKELTKALRRLVAEYVDHKRSSRGHIGRDCRIINAGTLRNVWVGDKATIDGASQLINGSIMSEPDAPVRVGINVMARDFILAAGATVEGGAVLVNTFVGQASEISHLFSAHESLFFANCYMENGESAAIFAGPYTVSHHKSSLLIAGMFSFLNAGSGSNQSNHMYKLGPIHQGVVERGSKTTSDSYVLWPAHIGAFSLVMGRHVSHPDTSRLPFSYLIEAAGTSHLVPGVNLKSVGTIRDSMKWPKRDKRTARRQLDLVNFNLLSPLTIGQMVDGIKVLDDIERTSGATSSNYSYQGMTITASALRKGREYYRMAIDKFMGNSLLKRLEGAAYDNDGQIRERLRPTVADGAGRWMDLAGMIAPQSLVDRLMDDIKSGAVATLDQVDERLRQIHGEYYDLEWTWVASMAPALWGKPVEEFTAADVRRITDRWEKAVVDLDRMLYDDARKEFSSVARIGFGLYDAAGASADDFEQVRGDFEADPFVRMVQDHIAAKSALAADLRSRLK